MSTLQQLRTYYANALHVSYASTPADLATLAADVDAGRTTFDAAVANVERRSIQTTGVAELSYQFFTGATLRPSGLDYLVSPNGPNPNNLNSAYYQNFNLENRYINFAINLGTAGEGAARFSAAYGSLSLADTLVKSYTEIFGYGPTAQQRTALLGDTVPNGRGGTYTRADYFADIGHDGLNGQGTKAALVGWLLAQAAKEDIGVYAKAEDALIADLAPDGLARFNADLVASYGPASASTAGATITFANNQSVAPDATDAALRSTNNADTITGANGLDAVRSVLSGDGADVITVTGAVAGSIDSGAGNDRIAVETLNTPVMVLGAPNNGSISTGAGDDVLTVTRSLQNGSRIDGGLGDDSAYVTTDGLGAATRISGFEHLYLVSNFPTLDLSGVSGARDIWDVAATDYAVTQSWTNVAPGTVVGVRTLSKASFTVDFAAGATSAELHIDGVQGFPAGHITQSGMLGFPDATNILVRNVYGPLVVSVDRDSSLGTIASYNGGEIDIVGLGTLNATVSPSASPTSPLIIDASAAARVNIHVTPGSTANRIVLSSGDDTVTADLQIQAVSTFTLGAGSDIFAFEGNASLARFSNLRLTAGRVDAFATITDFSKGVDHLLIGPLAPALTPGLTAYASGSGSLEQALTAVSSNVPANGTGVFEYAGDTFIYHQDATLGVNTGDGLVRLVGVTGLTTGASGGGADIRYG